MNDPLTQSTQKIQEGIIMVQKLGELAVEYLVKYGFQVLGGFIILFVGFKISGWVSKAFVDLMSKRKVDITLTKFMASILRAVILGFVFLMAIEKFGVTIAPMIAAASALVFGTSFALQAPLSNYAAGLMVILTRPFVVGNTVQVQGVSGVVEEVKLPCTVLVTEDGERITIPNKEIVGQIVWNSAEYKVVERTIGISYDDDPSQAIRVIREALRSVTQVRQKPDPILGIEGFGDFALQIGLRYWVPTKEYYNVMYAANLAIFEALKKAKITIPYPQTVIHQASPKV